MAQVLYIFEPLILHVFFFRFIFQKAQCTIHNEISKKNFKKF